MFELVLFPLSGNQSPVFKSCVENLGSIGCLPTARCQNSLSKYKSADILKQVISWNDFLLHTIQNSQLSFFVWPRKAQRVAFVGGAHRQCAQLPLDSCEPLWHRSHSHSHLGSRFPWLSLQKWHFSGMTTSDSISYYSAQNHWSRKSTCRLLTGLMDNIPNVASHTRPIRDQTTVQAHAFDLELNKWLLALQVDTQLKRNSSPPPPQENSIGKVCCLPEIWAPLSFSFKNLLNWTLFSPRPCI